MLRAATLAIAALLATAADASAIEMFTFYGNGEHYAGYPFSGQHYVRANGFDEHFAGTSYMAYARPEFRGHGHHAQRCGCQSCNRDVNPMHVWDGYCTEKSYGRRHHGLRMGRHDIGCGRPGCACMSSSTLQEEQVVGEDNTVEVDVPTEATPGSVEPSQPEGTPAPALEDNPPQPPMPATPKDNSPSV